MTEPAPDRTSVWLWVTRLSFIAALGFAAWAALVVRMDPMTFAICIGAYALVAWLLLSPKRSWWGPGPARYREANRGRQAQLRRWLAVSLAAMTLFALGLVVLLALLARFLGSVFGENPVP